MVGTELVTWRGRTTSLVRAPSVLVRERKVDALWQVFDGVMPEARFGDRRTQTTHS
jgi:hypothetical protein